MAVFEEQLYVGTFNKEYREWQPVSKGTEIWRFDSRQWQRVVDMEIPQMSGTRNLQVYDGMLYAGIDNRAGCEVWRSPDGTIWEPILQGGGFGNESNKSLRGMAEYQGRLYVGVQNAKTGGEIHAWDGESWAMIADRGITNPGNIVAAEMITWRGLLYIFMWNIYGLEAYTYDGTSFDLIIGPGAPVPAGMGRYNKNPAATSVYVYHDRLYLGTANFFDGAEVWRTDDGVNWVRLADNGLDDRLQNYFWCMMEYRGNLFVGTFVIPNGNPQEEGGRIYRIDPEENIVELVGPKGTLMGPGFGVPENWGIRSMAVFQDKLYMGTAQNFIGAPYAQGTQIWELDPDACGCDLQQQESP